MAATAIGFGTQDKEAVQAAPAITDVSLEYNPDTPDWVWVTVQVGNIDMAGGVPTLFVTRGGAENLEEGRMPTKDEFVISDDGLFYFGMWLPDRYYPEGTLPVELHLCSGDSWSCSLTFNAETPLFRALKQGFNQVADDRAESSSVADMADDKEKK